MNAVNLNTMEGFFATSSPIEKGAKNMFELEAVPIRQVMF
jgi:hypothetical protein